MLTLASCQDAMRTRSSTLYEIDYNLHAHSKTYKDIHWLPRIFVHSVAFHSHLFSTLQLTNPPILTSTMKFILSSLLALSAIGFAFAEENNTSTDETCNNGVEVIKKHIGEKYTQEIVGSLTPCLLGWTSANYRALGRRNRGRKHSQGGPWWPYYYGPQSR